MPLSDTRIRSAKPQERPYKLVDGGGLYLLVTPTRAKLWRYRYRLGGKENVFAIGSYPGKGLAEARDDRDAAKKLIAKGQHPSHHRKLERIQQTLEHANTFQAIADEWLERQTKRLTPRPLLLRRKVLERDVYPHIGALPMRQVTPAHVLDIIQRIEKRAPTVAALARRIIGGVCRHAITTLRAEVDVTAPLGEALAEHDTKHSHPLARTEIRGFMEALEGYRGLFSSKAAVRLLFLTLTRTMEMVGAKWSEVDLEAATWSIPAARMKMAEDHVVPLPTQAVELLKAVHHITGRSPYVFPNRNSPHRPASRGMVWKVFEGMGYFGRFSPHGIRSTGSTILNEMGFRSDLIERQLAHKERNKSRGSYNRAEYLPERKEMMQAWADLLDTLAAGDSNVVPGRFHRAA
jgi:integrase